MKHTKMIPALLGLVPPALRLTRGEINRGWESSSYREMSGHPCAISNNNSQFLSQDRNSWQPPNNGGIWTLAEIRADIQLMNQTIINIYGGTHKVSMETMLHNETVWILKAEPLNPTARQLAANRLPLPIPDELTTWQQIHQWLNDGAEVELPPLPEAVMDTLRPQLRVTLERIHVTTGKCQFTSTRQSVQEFYFTAKQMREMIKESLAAGEGFEGFKTRLEKAAFKLHDEFIVKNWRDIARLTPSTDHQYYVPEGEPKVSDLHYLEDFEIRDYLINHLPEEAEKLNLHTTEKTVPGVDVLDDDVQYDEADTE